MNAIAKLNDEFRTTLVGGRTLITPGIQNLSPRDQRILFSRIRSFNAFGPSNDPHGEHDFGAVLVNDTTCYFKIDYYDKTMEYGSEDPSNPEVTTRVMTVMLASEY